MPRRPQSVSGVPFHYNGVTVEMKNYARSEENSSASGINIHTPINSAGRTSEKAGNSEHDGLKYGEDLKTDGERTQNEQLHGETTGTANRFDGHGASESIGSQADLQAGGTSPKESGYTVSSDEAQNMPDSSLNSSEDVRSIQADEESATPLPGALPVLPFSGVYDTSQVTGSSIPLQYKRAPLETMPDDYDCRGEKRAFIPDFGKSAGFNSNAAPKSAVTGGSSGDTNGGNGGNGGASGTNSRNGSTGIGGIGTSGGTYTSDYTSQKNTLHLGSRDIPDLAGSNSYRPSHEKNSILERLTANLGTEELILAALLILMLGERRDNDGADDDLMLLIAFLLLSGR